MAHPTRALTVPITAISRPLFHGRPTVVRIARELGMSISGSITTSRLLQP